MRLICPNCDAQYEVPDEVMPQEGRDLQCSSCGQTWFQGHPDAELETSFEPPAESDDPDEEVVRTPIDPPAVEKPPHPEPTLSKNIPTFEPVSPEEAPSAPKRKPLDPAVADVLREEAELEARARINEALGGVESQPDLGLDLADSDDEADRRAQEARERMARMRGEPSMPEDVSEQVAAAAAISSRRDLLPDIEEINSTLRSNSDRSPNTDAGQTAQVEVREARSSRRGFILVVALVAILALIYVYAPRLSETVPALAPVLDGYVGIVNQWRGWLDGKVEALLSWLDAAAVSSSR